ncbi:hypothetical protein RB195_003627 [Necator americanus]|uniref:ERAP1-like C-terminal domain-containing protein n=1 Tax=Necator americanus TaxID=51031 RepID=A0ABR1DPH7_NECAM
MRFNDNRWTRAVSDWVPRDIKRTTGRPPTRWSDFFTKSLKEKYDALRVPRERRNHWATLARDRDKWKNYWRPLDQFEDQRESSKVATSLTETMCRIGEKNCTKTFRSLFEKEILNRCKKGEKASECVRIKRHLRRCTYCTGVRTLGAVALRKVENLLKVEDDIEERKALVDGASCVRSIKKLERILLKRLEDTNGDVRDRQENIVWAFRATQQQVLSDYFLFPFCVEHWELIYERLKTRLDYINEVISTCFGTVHSTAQLMLIYLDWIVAFYLKPHFRHFSRKRDILTHLTDLIGELMSSPDAITLIFAEVCRP